MESLVNQTESNLTQYDPELGLKAVALAETAEKYFRRAKDAAQLFKAVELKLTEQRKFVLWWDSHGNPKGGPKNFVDSAKFPGYPGPDTLHRWRIRLKPEAKFEQALQGAQERCVRVCEASKGSTEQRGASGTNENEWFTPDEYITRARTVLGAIDLDPATHPMAQSTIQATRHYTKADDGLEHEWLGRVWLNPPYMQPFVTLFIEKLVAEYTAGRTTAAMLLTHNYTDTGWFHHAASAASAICFTRGRVKFLDPNGEEAAPTQGQAFFYLGADVDRFAETFADVGFVVTPWKGRG